MAMKWLKHQTLINLQQKGGILMHIQLLESVPKWFSIITGMYSARLGAHNMRTGDYHNYKTPEQVTTEKILA